MKKKALLFAVCIAAVLAFGTNSAVADDLGFGLRIPNRTKV